MFIGLDVGGTNTDAVLLDTAFTVLQSCKVPTTHNDVGQGIVQALQLLLDNQNPASVSRVCVSSTLALNALLTNRYDTTGLLLVPGPGLTPPPSWESPLIRVLSGAQNHLGTIIARPDELEVNNHLAALKEQNAKALGIVCKFSPKNPALEEWLQSLALDFFPEPEPIVLGSSLSGTLNFPRRVETAWCQAALTSINTRFIQKLEEAMAQMGLRCPLDILKADGGTFAHTIAARNPANSIGSGPAASILGALPEASPTGDTAIISIGGTTTDIAILAAGEPLLLKEGLLINGKGTLIKGMHTQSIALGGDSSLAVSQGRLIVKPERLGPALCLCPDDIGKRPPTVTDALRLLGLHTLGGYPDAEKAMQPIARDLACTVEESARQTLACVLDMLGTTLANFVEALNSQPVYTIREIQYTDPIKPQHTILIGAPAPALAQALEKYLEMPVSAPDNAGIANAIGAALARPTVDAELYADTNTGLMSIAPYGITKKISKRYSLEEARNDLTDALTNALHVTYAQYTASHKAQGGTTASSTMDGESADDLLHLGAPESSLIQIVFAETFHTLSGHGDRGKIVRLKAQVSPGILGAHRQQL